MMGHADVLRREDPRISEIFDIEAEEAEMHGMMMVDDPYPGFARLLAKGPVQEGGVADLMGYDSSKDGFQFHYRDVPIYTVLSFAAASKVFIDNALFSSRAYDRESMFAPSGAMLLNAGGKVHRMYRDPIQPLFSPDFAGAWWRESVIDEAVDALVGGLEGRGSADLHSTLCARLPVHVVTAGFGLDSEQIIDFRLALLNSSNTGITAEERKAAARTVDAILLDVINDRRRNPQDDIISRLAQMELRQEDGSTRPYTDDELVQQCRIVVHAGGGTTWRQLAITLYALLENPDQLAALKADRSLMSNVVLESARWHSNVTLFPRYAEADTVLEGVAIPKGAIIHVCLAAANWDPARWENPERFDIRRPVQRSLAFGAGAHSCLGQHVSRSEMVVALNAVLDRLPNLRWDPSKPKAHLMGSLFHRGVNALPVNFD